MPSQPQRVNLMKCQPKVSLLGVSRLWPALTLLALGTQARAETFDLATYRVPAGYQKTAGTSNVVRYVKQTSSTYCILDVYRRTVSTGNLNTDFQQEWQAIVAGPLGADDPQVEKGPEKGGWHSQVGGAAYEHEGTQGLALLSTFSGYNLRLSVLMLTNTKACVDDLDTFLSGLTLGKPPTTTGPTKPPAPTTTAPVNAPASTGFKYNTTTFTEGWTATQQKDWVQVVRGSTTVRLHYAVPYTDQTRTMSPDDRVVYFWNQLVQPRYAAQQIKVAPTESGVGVSSFGESDATEVGTGRQVHVALLLYSENGQAYVTEVVAPNAATLNAQFKSYDQIRAMRNFNKFQVDPSDLSGTWENSSSAYGMYYSTVTGNFLGMSGASTYDKFVFGRNGSYAYEYIGVSGQVGAQSVAQGKRTGTIKFSGWEASTTDNTGKTDTYFIQFEAIRGGRILHLQNKKYSGLQYHLVRTK